MRLFMIFLVAVSISIVGCDDDECPIANSLYGYWSVESIIEEDTIVQRQNPNDTIEISFDPHLKIMFGHSYANELIAHFEVFENDSIWIGYVGGTDVGPTLLEIAFRNIIPNVTYLEFKKYNDLVLHTTDRKSQISLNKYE